MADTKHTPGPWKVYRNKDGQRFIITDGKGGISKQDCKASFIDSEANARLIAAAPELLEACLASHNAKTQSDLDRAVKMIEAAIAKAKGGAA